MKEWRKFADRVRTGSKDNVFRKSKDSPPTGSKDHVFRKSKDSPPTGSKDHVQAPVSGSMIYAPNTTLGDHSNLALIIEQMVTGEQEPSLETKIRQLRDHLAAHDPTFQAQQLHGSVANAYEWIFQEQSFTRWYNNDGPSTLWINGPPGIGKSTMLRGILEASSSSTPEGSSDVNLAYFFCDETDSSRRTTDAILRAFLFLLMNLDVPQSQEIQEMLKALKLLPDPAFITGLFWACLEQFRNSKKNVLLVVDAVDECTDSNTHLLSLISKTMAMSDFAQLRWLISSRESHEIKSGINPENNLCELKLQTNRDKLEPALESYIEGRVSSLKLQNKVAQDVVLRLMERAQGMFLWTRLDCDRIEALPEPRILEEVDDLDVNLDHLYEKAVARAKNNVSKKGYFTTTAHSRSLDRILGLAAISHRNLSLNTVKTIWGWASGNDDLAYMKDLVKNSGLLVMKDEIITFVHSSAKTYLQRKHSTYAAILHHDMALRLLEIMKSKLRPDMLKLVRRNVLVLGYGPAEIEASADNEQWEQLQDTLEYACIEWMHHLERVCFLNNAVMDDPKTVEMVSGLLTETLCPWLEAVSLFKRYSEIMIRIRCFEDLLANSSFRPGGSLQQKQKRRDLYRLVREARQFIYFNWASISGAPLRATSSAATFIPKKSRFWKRSHSLRNPPPPLRVRRIWGEADDWDACVLSIVTKPGFSPEEVSFTREGDSVILVKRHVLYKSLQVQQ
uniref:NACHT domain-containing protein n=1 Tax=Bionectria ochroleuca TaxID=29856 RepID=A0A8H7TT66_BIOOC